MKKNDEQFWIVNVTKKDLFIQDLFLTIKAYKMINLLDKKHYNLKIDQIIKSCESGSLYKKKNLIHVRECGPQKKHANKTEIDEDSIIPNREKSIFEMKEEKFEELSITDEEFAAENI